MGAGASAGSASGASGASGALWPWQLVGQLAAYLRGQQQQQQECKTWCPQIMASAVAFEALLELRGSGRERREGGEEQAEQQRVHLATLRAAVAILHMDPESCPADGWNARVAGRAARGAAAAHMRLPCVC